MKILFLAMALAVFSSCNNSADQDAEISDTTAMSPVNGDIHTTTPTNGEMNANSRIDSMQGTSGDTATFGGASNDSIGK